MRRTTLAFVASVVVVAPGLVLAVPATEARAQAPGETAPAGDASSLARISATWEGAPVRDVVKAFAAFSGRSIVVGAAVDGFVTADINDQPWDVALAVVLASLALTAVEDEYGIIRVDDMRALAEREGVDRVVTRTYRLSYAKAVEIQATIAPLLSERGTVSVVQSTNTLVVSDIPRLQRVVAGLIGR